MNSSKDTFLTKISFYNNKCKNKKVSTIQIIEQKNLKLNRIKFKLNKIKLIYNVLRFINLKKN